MKGHRIGIAAAGLLALTVGVLWLPADPVIHMVPPSFACAVAGVLLATWPRSRTYLTAASIAVATVSITTTLVFRTFIQDAPEQPNTLTALWMLLEPGVLAAFVYLCVRWLPIRTAVIAGSACALAGALVLQRYIAPSEGWIGLFGSAFWLTPSLAVALVAWYLRSLDVTRERAVADARQQQRLDLAGDLHDFVAHDVSEIVAQAQAGRMVLAAQDPRVAEVLERIETAGLRALASMDRTVHMLRDSGRTPIGGLADLDALAERFDASGTARVRLNLADSTEVVPRETAAVAYRVAVEALTNVRRHTRNASTVDIDVTCADGHLRLSITDDGHADTRPNSRASAGLGLPGLAERVEALGGHLESGPRQPHGWRLTARLPITDDQQGTS